MGKFLEMYSHLRVNQEKEENIKRAVSSNEIESIIWKLPAN